VSSPDQIVLCDGKGVCCWPAHRRRTGATLCTHGDHRSLLLRGDAGVGKSTLIQRASVKPPRRFGECCCQPPSRRRRRWSGAASVSSAARATVPSAPRGQFAAVVTEHEPKYGGNSPDCRTPP